MTATHSSAAAAVASNLLTPAERELAHEHLHQVQAGLTGAIKGLSAAQWNFAPAGKWSISEIVEHVIFVYELVEGRIREQLSSGPTPEAGRDNALIDAIVIHQFPARLAKFPAPEISKPSGCYATPAEALARLAKIQARTAEYIDTAGNLRQHVLESAPLKAITKGVHTTMDGYQWILAPSAHAERHTKQILEVRADANFPV